MQQIPAEKSPDFTAVLIFFILGLDHKYNGQIGKGIGMIIVAVTGAFLILNLIRFLFYLILWFYEMYNS